VVELDIERRIPLDVDWDGRVMQWANQNLKLKISPQEQNLEAEEIHFH
jgi:hypothetical protein